MLARALIEGRQESSNKPLYIVLSLQKGFRLI